MYNYIIIYGSQYLSSSLGNIVVSVICLVDFWGLVGVGVSCSLEESIISGLLFPTLLPVAPVSIIGNELHRAPSSDLRASMLLVITLLGRLFDLLQLWSFCSFLKKHDAFSLARHLVVGRE